MDQMTQKNAAMVEETTAASETLADESRQLQTLLARFKLEETSRPHQMQPSLQRTRYAA
jgi:methyl-accepting chemotaxis protein